MWLRILYTCGKLVAIAHISTIWTFIRVVVKNESDGARVPSRTDSAGSWGIDDYQETCHHVSQDISAHRPKTVTDWCRHFLDTRGGKRHCFDWEYFLEGQDGLAATHEPPPARSPSSLPLSCLMRLHRDLDPSRRSSRPGGDGTGGWRWWRLTHMTDSYTNVREAQRDWEQRGRRHAEEIIQTRGPGRTVAVNKASSWL